MAKSKPQKRGSGWKLAAGAGVAAALLGGTKPGHHVVAELLSVRGGSESQNVKLGRAMAAQDYGWRGAQWDCLYTLWQGESGWSQYSDTRTSGLDPANASVFAYGIPQARPATKMPRSAQPASLGGRSNPKAQVRWGLGYIQARYGSPCNALAYKRAHGNKGY